MIKVCRRITDTWQKCLSKLKSASQQCVIITSLNSTFIAEQWKLWKMWDRVFVGIILDFVFPTKWQIELLEMVCLCHSPCIFVGFIVLLCFFWLFCLFLPFAFSMIFSICHFSFICFRLKCSTYFLRLSLMGLLPVFVIPPLICWLSLLVSSFPHWFHKCPICPLCLWNLISLC